MSDTERHNIKFFTLTEEMDDSGWSVRSQEVYDGDRCVYDVWNLDDCPEDAIIERCLFSANDWLRAVQYGIELASEGYTDVLFKEGKDG